MKHQSREMAMEIINSLYSLDTFEAAKHFQYLGLFLMRGMGLQSSDKVLEVQRG